MTDTEAKAVIEAALLASEKPLPVDQLRAAVEEYSPAQIEALVAQLQDEYVAQGRGVRVVEVGGGFQLVTDPAWAERLGRIYRKTRAARLSRPSLETLAIIAYRQPITRVEIEAIRGVDVSGVLDSLGERLLIQIVGRKEAVGRPLLYGTTQEFLERFGLKSLETLPALPEFHKLDESSGAASFGRSHEPEESELAESVSPTQTDADEHSDTHVTPTTD